MTPSSPPPTILFAEDDAGVRDTTTDLLSFTGANVHTVSSGREAWDYLARNRADLVITDVAMPDGDGYWLLARIRGDERLKRTRVVLLSAHALVQSISAGLDAGADAYLTKPFDPEHFIVAVQAYLTAIREGRPLSNHPVDQPLPRT